MKRLVFAVLSVIFILSAFPLAASTPVMVPEVRGVYYGGKVHFVALGNSASSTYQDYVVHCEQSMSTSSWTFNINSTPTAKIALPSNCYGKWEGGVGIMDDKIFYSCILWIGSSQSTSAPYLYCAVFDLVQGSFLSMKQVCKLSDSSPFVHSALAVYGDKVVIITNSTTVTSSDDGQSWTTQQYPILTAADKLAPIDAITFYPMGDSSASIMLLCADATNHYDGGAYSAIWAGQWGTPVAKTKFDTKGLYYGQLFSGTVKAPSSGNGSGYHTGQAAACIQAFINQDTGHGCVRYEYNLAKQSWSLDAYTNDSHSSYGFFAFQSYLDECAAADNNRCIQRQYIAINGLDSNMSWHSFAFYSDAMVPQFYDAANKTYWDGMLTATSEGTEAELKKLRNYWSIVGVVLGPPPFSVNDTAMDDLVTLRALSNVVYGDETESEVSQTLKTEDTVMMAADGKVKAGAKDEWGASLSVDTGFKYSWEMEHTNKTATVDKVHFKFGTDGEAGGPSPEDWGRRGWVLFNSPNMVTQWYKLYAYDYVVGNDTSGTPLNQDIQTIQAVGMVLQTSEFELADPGGSLDENPGLCSGIQPFPYSQQLTHWKEMNWEDTDAGLWSIRFGSGVGGGEPVSPLKQGVPGGIGYSTTVESVDSSGSTTGNDINMGATYSEGSELDGFEVGLKAGYDSKVSTNTEISTKGTQDIECDLEMSDTNCSDEGCVKYLKVQPYWLEATSYDAPWIPTNYSGELPWCMTWQVVSFESQGLQTIGPGGHPPDDSKVEIGNGTVTEIEGEEEFSREKWDSFSLTGGSLEWLGENGTNTPVPLTADTFDTTAGAEVKIAGYLLKTDPALGRWTRHGQVWRYKTREKAGPPAWTLDLNFAKRSWSIDAKKLVLHDKVRAAKRHIRVELVLNQKYTIYGDILYRTRTNWQHSEPAQDSDGLAVTGYSGSFDSKSGEGVVELEGTLPSSIGNFGDTTFVFNGISHDIPLLSMEDFALAMDAGKDLVYKRDGLVVRVDFGKKRWSASFKKDALSHKMAPLAGKCRLEIRVGGDLRYSKVFQIDNFKSKLTLP